MMKDKEIFGKLGEIPAFGHHARLSHLQYIVKDHLPNSQIKYNSWLQFSVVPHW